MYCRVNDKSSMIRVPGVKGVMTNDDTEFGAQRVTNGHEQGLDGQEAGKRVDMPMGVGLNKRIPA